jgi:hypothetical protein
MLAPLVILFQSIRIDLSDTALSVQQLTSLLGWKNDAIEMVGEFLPASSQLVVERVDQREHLVVVRVSSVQTPRCPACISVRVFYHARERFRTDLTLLHVNRMSCIPPPPDQIGLPPVGGELPVVPQRRLTEPVTAAIQPGPIRVVARRQSDGDEEHAWRSIGRCLAGTLGPCQHRARVMPQSASDTAHDSGPASDTHSHTLVRCPRSCAVPVSARRAQRACDDR